MTALASPPPRTPEQRMNALARANEVRFGMCAVKRELRDGGLSFTDAIYDDRAQRMPIFVLLTAQKQWGPARARRLLARASAPISERRTVGGLTGRQRREIVRLVGGR